jgi:hypothetical protein
MAGGLMQLVAYGAQDVYLTGNPQITFWKVVYRRHTNFAVESIEQVFNGTGDFGKKVVCQIQRNGDLITKMFLKVVLPALSAGYAWTPKVGHAMIKTAELNIGGTPIDKHYGDWMNVWYELARKFAHDRGYDIMIGNTTELTVSTVGTAQATLYVPLYFFCCRNDGLALPLIATQYHDTRIEIEFQPVSQLVCGTSAATAPSVSLVSCSLFVDYVYLDSEERKKFAQASHEYLIEQVQFTGAESVTSSNAKFRLSYNHPCKALYWNVQQNKYINTNGTYKFLAWNPKNVEDMRLRATRRAALAWGTFNSGTGLYSVTVDAANPWRVALNGAQVAGPDVSGNVTDADNLVILGTPLPDWFISSTIDEIAAGLVSITRTTTSGSDGLASNDIVVRQWDNYGVFLNKNSNPVDQVLLQLNGQDRFSKRDGNYFNYVMPWQCHSNTPCDGLNMFSFALNPEEHQPSGTCNMSRIDNATLNIDFISSVSYSTVNNIATKTVSVASDAKCNIYATNYNVLRIMSGMAGLAYSN